MTALPAWSIHLPSGTEPDAPLDLVRGRSLVQAWRDHWQHAPDRPVVKLLGRDDWLTAADLDRGTRDAAAKLAAAGARPGDRVVLSAGTSVDFVVAYVGALRLGLVVVPMNTAYKEREVAHVVTDAGATLAIVDDDERAGWIRHAQPRAVITTPSLAGLEVGSNHEPLLDRTTSADPALIGYTSGTTGAPKGAVLTHGNLLASAEAVAMAWRWTSNDRLLIALPLFHMHGLGVGVHGTLTTGGQMVLIEKFESSTVLDAIEAERATLFFGVPTMYTRLVADPKATELAKLRLCVSGSAPLPPDLFGRIEAAANGRKPLERYGMTETAMLVSNPYEGERRAGSVGFPLPGLELKLAPNTQEIWVRGPNVFGGYWNRPEATADSFTDDGYFRTGDVGEFDPDGYLKIVGRTKELIITGGFNVYPREIEDVVRAHPGVGDVAVVGIPNPEWGETVVACVERADNEAGQALDDEQLLEFAAAELAPFKKPRAVHFVENLPRNALGKVVRAELVKAILTSDSEA
ncbi:MAG: class I adenylate-forming enzyme family protein [Acidimicrobiia bacterium]